MFLCVFHFTPLIFPFFVLSSKVALAIIQHFLQSASKPPCCQHCSALRSPYTPRAQFTQVKSDLIISKMVNTISATKTPVQTKKYSVSPASSNLTSEVCTPLTGSALLETNNNTNRMVKSNSNHLQVPSSFTASQSASVGNKVRLDGARQTNGSTAVNGHESLETETLAANFGTTASKLVIDITNNPDLMSCRNAKQSKLVRKKPHVKVNDKGDSENRPPSPRVKLIDTLRVQPDQANSPNFQIPIICVTPPAESGSNYITNQAHDRMNKETASKHDTDIKMSNKGVMRKDAFVRQSNFMVSVPPKCLDGKTKLSPTDIGKTASGNTNESKFHVRSNVYSQKHNSGDVCICDSGDTATTNPMNNVEANAYGDKTTAAKYLYSFFRNAFLGLRRRPSKTPSQNSEQETAPSTPSSVRKLAENADSSPVQDGLANALSSMALVTNSSR